MYYIYNFPIINKLVLFTKNNFSLNILKVYIIQLIFIM